MPIAHRGAAATMADQLAVAAAADNMEINTHVSRVVQVEVAKTKARVPATDISNAFCNLGDRPPRGLLDDDRDIYKPQGAFRRYLLDPCSRSLDPVPFSTGVGRWHGLSQPTGRPPRAS